MSLTATVGYVLWMLVCGWSMGTAFDLYNTVSAATKVLRPIRPVFDMLFWILSAGTVYYLTFITIQGQFRLYTLLLLIVGYAIYRITFRQWIVESALFIVRVIRSTLKFFAHVVYVLFGLPLIAFGRLCITLLKVVYALLMMVENIVSQIVRFALLILMLPILRYLKPEAVWRKKLVQLEKGFWDWLSNLLTKNWGSPS